MNNLGQNPWTPEEDELLRKLARSGESVTSITKRLNRSDHSVRTRAMRLNIVLAKSRTPEASQQQMTDAIRGGNEGFEKLPVARFDLCSKVNRR